MLALLFVLLATPVNAACTTYQIHVSGFDREYCARNEIANPDAAVLDAHAGDVGMLLREAAVQNDDPNMVTIFLQAMVWTTDDDPLIGTNRHWIATRAHDTATGFPPGATVTTDLEYINAVAAEVRAVYGVSTVYLRGYSDGGLMTLYVLTEPGQVDVDGFAVFLAGLAHEHDAYLSQIDTDEPLLYWVAWDDPFSPGGCGLSYLPSGICIYSYADSYAKLRPLYTSKGPKLTSRALCTGPNVVLWDYAGQDKELEGVNGTGTGHAYRSCTGDGMEVVAFEHWADQ